MYEDEQLRGVFFARSIGIGHYGEDMFDIVVAGQVRKSGAEKGGRRRCCCLSQTFSDY